MLWENLRSEEFNDAVEACNRVYVIPIGCVEAHGVHMPLGCDTIKAREFSVRAAEIANVCVFPAMYFGEKGGAGEYPGTIIFPIPLICEILEQSCSEIARNGFKKIILLNSHGGNTNMLNAFLRNILCKKPDYLVYHYYQKMAGPDRILAELEKYPYLTDEDIAVLQDFVDKKKLHGHGCFIETACLYDICPELVRLDRMDAVSGKSTGLFNDFEKHGVVSSFSFMANYPNSLCGDYHPGLNERIAKAIAAKTVEMTADAFSFVRNETVSEAFHKEWLAKQK